MNKIFTMLTAAVLTLSTTAVAAEKEMIGKQTLTLNSRYMTPEVLWAMGRIATAEASPDGKKIVYQVGYYSVKENKSRQVLRVVDADGNNDMLLTTDKESETDPAWIDNGNRIAFIKGGELWTMNADGTDRKCLSDTKGEIWGFKFAPNGKKVILIKSIPFNEIIKKTPDDLPLSTGRLVTDLMYRHWDHYVEQIVHPFVADVTENGIGEATDILNGEPYECPLAPFGGIEQLAWSADSKSIAYTCRKKEGVEYAISTDSDIYLYDLETGKSKNLCKPEGYKEPAIDATKTMKNQAVNMQSGDMNVGYDQNPKFSPDGKYVAWLSMARNGYESDRNRLCMYNLATGEKTYLTESFDSNVDDFCWSDTKDALIYFIGVWHATENLYAITKKGEVKQLTDYCADFGSLQMLGDHKHILAERHSYGEPADLYVITPGKDIAKTSIVQITAENKHITDQLAKIQVEKRWVKTDDGRDMLYWVV